MAKTKTITVMTEFKLGFDHSYSSIGQIVIKKMSINEGDDEDAVLAAMQKETAKKAAKLCWAFKAKHDIVREDGRKK